MCQCDKSETSSPSPYAGVSAEMNARIMRGTHAAYMADKGIWTKDEAKHFERTGHLPAEDQVVTA